MGVRRFGVSETLRWLREALLVVVLVVVEFVCEGLLLLGGGCLQGCLELEMVREREQYSRSDR